MPLYQYQCLQCNYEEEARNRVDERADHLCSKCGSQSKIKFAPFNPIVFQEQVFEHLDVNPVRVSSRRQLKEECKRRGVWAKCLD